MARKARGRTAKHPTDIPAKGWKDIVFRLKDEVAEDHVGLIAAGVAFYALLAIFPAITALMSLAGLILEPSHVTAQIEAVSSVMPQAAADIILGQAVEVAGSEQTGLGIALGVSLLLAIYSASKGTGSLMEGLNVAYDEDESRSFFKKLLVTLALTVFAILAVLVGLIAALAVPATLDLVQLPGWIETGLALLRWVILAVVAVFGLSVLYRYGPARSHAQWSWLSPGATLACVLWVAASIGFSLYVSNFSSYNETFGSVAGVIILLMWLWISAFIVILGAELNAEIEAQTVTDTTTGADAPMGKRNAYKADTLGRST